MIVAGGRTENNNDYHWDIVIPVGQSGQLHLIHESDSTAAPRSKTLKTIQLTAGLQLLQVRVNSADNDAESSELTFYVVGKNGNRVSEKLTVPRVSYSDSASIKGWKPVRASDWRIDLLYFATNQGKQVLRLRLELQ